MDAAGSTAARAPGLALLAALVIAFVLFLAFSSGEVDLEKDDGYRAASEITGWKHRLAHQRTFGYPLFLRGVSHFSPDFALLPYVQAVIFLAALGFFYVCLRGFGLSPWTSFFGTVPMAANNLLLPMAQRVLTDTVAVAVAIAAIGTLLLALAVPSGKRWAVFAAVLFLAYQVRPVYVFLVPLAPVLAFLLLCGDPLRRSWRQALASAGRVAALAFVPLLLFCLLRLVVVGHFGLVSFGGFNLIGIAASLLSEDTVAALPKDLRPLGQAILAGRSARGLEPIQDQVSRFPGRRQIKWYREFNDNVWRVSGRAAYREAFGRYDALHPRPNAGEVDALERWRKERRSWANVETDRRLMALSLAVLSQHRGLYADWLRRGLSDSLRWTFRRVRGVAFCVLALAAATVFFWSRYVLAGKRGLRAGARAFASALRAASPLLWIGVCSCAANLLLVSLVERPVDRYVQAAAVLLPGGFLALGWELVARAARREHFAAAGETMPSRRAPR